MANPQTMENTTENPTAYFKFELSSKTQIQEAAEILSAYDSTSLNNQSAPTKFRAQEQTTNHGQYSPPPTHNALTNDF
jgi:hypothetical protein